MNDVRESLESLCAELGATEEEVGAEYGLQMALAWKRARDVLADFESDEPLTVERLQEIGFTRFCDGLKSALGKRGLSVQWLHDGSRDDTGLGGGYWTYTREATVSLPRPKTLGELRRLMSAFRIEI